MDDSAPASVAKAVVEGIQILAKVTAGAVNSLTHDKPEVLQAPYPAAIDGVDHSHEREDSPHRPSGSWPA
jgi:hypothetical protein